MELLSIKEVCKRIGVSRTTLWTLSKQPSFPKLVPLTTQRRVYLKSEVDRWIEERVALRDKTAA